MVIQMNCLVIGYGSIGARHTRVLNELGCHTAIVSSHASGYPDIFRNLEEALVKEKPEYVIIANNTSEHFQTLKKLGELGYEGIVLAEKPLFESCRTLPQHKFKHLLVGYNLRFHPIIRQLQGLMKTDKILSVQAYVGQYLPQWRPDRDYSTCYSASKEAGGGVLRDLSHELDYINWLLGGWRRLMAQGGKYSSLKIDSDDLACLLMETGRCSVVNIQLNYLDRISQREIIINSDQHTIRADLVQGLLNLDGNIQTFAIDRDFTYRSMHQAVVNSDYRDLCSYEEGMEVLKMIEAAETSIACERWICNE